MLGGWSHTARAGEGATVVLNDSIRPVSQSSANGAVDIRRPYISRATLKPQEASAAMTLELPLKIRNLADLEARVAKGERISPQELMQKYMPAARDYQTVVGWAKSQGLTITRQDDHRLALYVSASVGKIAGALNVNFARVTYQGKEFTSAINAPTVPAALSTVLQGITGLQPHLRPHKHSIRRLAKAAQQGSAQYTPAQIATAYNVAALYTNDLTGSGQTIAISIDTFPSTTDLVQYWSTYNVNQSLGNIQFVQTTPGEMDSPSGEETLDTEWASSIAPGAKVRVYGATQLANTNLDAQYQQIIDDVTQHPELNIHELTMSYGSQETDTDGSELQNDDGLFATLASQGVTIFASSGDGGSTPDDNGGSDGALQPENPADDPNVAGVGGTSLQLNANNTASSETVWNDIAEGGGAGGGGTSGSAEPSNSDFTGFARPSWQTGTGVNTSAKRQVPDLAATADPQFGGDVVLDGQVTVYGGTSLASPICAAIFSLVNQARTNAGESTLGLLAPHIYPQIGASSPVLTDIKTGNNYNQGNDAAIINDIRYYSATTGYDECTGVGTPLGLQLAKVLVGSNNLVGVKFPVPQQEITPGATATFTVAVSGATASYQWQRQAVGTTGFVDVTGGSYTGATSATLTVTGATTAMSGDQFQCVVTLPATTVTTSPPSSLAVETPLAVAALAGDTGVVGHTNGSGTTARFNYPSGIALANGNLYVADFGNNQVREVTATGSVTTPFGNLNGAAGHANSAGNSATFNGPNGIASDTSGNLYVADSGNNAIRKITGNTVTTLSSVFNAPMGVAVDSTSGNVYVADTGNDTIDMITPGGNVSVLAGQTGNPGYQDGASGNALFNAPEAVAVDTSGNVWVADLGNSAIREISSGTVSTPAGTGGVAGYVDGPGAGALFNGPTGVSFDGTGNLFITDSIIPAIEQGNPSNQGGNCIVRRLSPAGAVTTLAGDPGVAGSVNATGASAKFYSIQALACVSGGIYACDTYNQTLRALGTPTTTSGGSSGGTPPLISLTGLAETYTGSPQAITAATNPSGLPVAVTYSSSTYTASTTPPTAVGSYTVTATVNDPPYSGTTTATLVISKATATVTFGSLAATYDGQPQSVTATTTPSGLDVTISYDGSSTAPTSAGSYTVTATINDANYAGSSQGTFVISPVVATIVLGNLNLTYTGKAQEATATTTPVGLPVVFTYDGSTLAPTAVGSYKVVGNINSTNSSGTATGTLVISPATATITLGSLTAIYTGKPHAATATTVPAKLPVTFVYSSASYAGSSVAPSVVGSYSVVATVTTTDYTGTQAGTLTITPVPPLATTLAATVITTTGATLNGSSNPEGSATTLSFQYGLTTAYGSVSSGRSIGNGTVAVTVAIPVTGLAVGTTYHFRTVATSLGGIVNGADKTFLTLGPGFSTAAQSYLAASGAQLSLSVNPNGVATSVYFIYSTDPTLSTFSTTATQNIGSGKTAVNVLAFLSGLQSGTTYYFEAVMTSGGVTFTSSPQSFTTLGFDTTLVVATATAAPGTAFNFATLGNGAVNSADGAAFRGTLTGAAAASNTGIWANVANAGTLSRVAQTGSVAPDVNGSATTADFSALTDPVYNDNGDVAFGGTLKVATGVVTAATENGVWASNSGTLALVAREGSAAPGTGGALFATFTAAGLSDNNGAIVAGTLTNSTSLGVTASNNAGIWEGATASALTLMLRTGEMTNTGKTIASFKFLPVETYVNGQTRGFSPVKGRLAATATYTDKTTGIIEVITPGSPVAVATLGDVAAGTTGATFATFDSPAVNDSDDVAFQATLKAGVGDATTKNDGGIWAGYVGGSPDLVARLGEIAPGTGSNATFLTFSDPVYNAKGAVAFRATLSTGTGLATATTNIGLWCNSSGSLTRVAQTGGQAPGCATGVTFSAFTELALDNVDGATQQGGTVFLATLIGTGVTTTNNTGIFAVDDTGTLRLIVRTGDVLNGKTITALAFLPAETSTGNAPVNGQGRGLSPSTGDLIYNATFSDKSTAIFNVVFQ